MNYDKYTSISIVTPLVNEEGSIDELYKRLTSVCKEQGYQYEILFVDDGSTDSSHARLKAIAKRDACVKVFKFRKNLGRTAALTCGHDHAQGNIVVTIDADLQENPEDIPLFVDKIKKGYGVASGWRQKRKDKLFLRKVPSYFANKLIGAVTGVHIHDYGCSLKAYRRRILKDIAIYGEMHRFMPALISWAGGKVTEIPINHNPRRYGKSKCNSLWRTFEVILDLFTLKFMTGYTIKPMYFFGAISFLSSIFGTLSLCVVSYRVLILKRFEATPLIFFMLIFYIASIQFVLMGFLADMLMRVRYEATNKKFYFIETTENVT